MRKNGFTLVELSIVLVIIGLLIGGILVGQSLIESAKINKTIQTLQQIHIAMKNFKTTYKYWAGDLPNAYDMFGATCGTNTVTSPPHAGGNGCNGDGSGVTNDGRVEARISWTHLTHANMWGSKKFGPSLFGDAGDYKWDYASLAKNSIPTPYNNVYFITYTPYHWFFTYPVMNPMGGGYSIASTPAPDAVFQDSGWPKNVPAILDQKMDDGNPSAGQVRGGSDCAQAPYTKWDLNTSSPTCAGYIAQPPEYY